MQTAFSLNYKSINLIQDGSNRHIKLLHLCFSLHIMPWIEKNHAMNWVESWHDTDWFMAWIEKNHAMNWRLNLWKKRLKSRYMRLLLSYFRLELSDMSLKFRLNGYFILYLFISNCLYPVWHYIKLFLS